MTERLDTLIVGGGQAGLSLSYYLTQSGREHVVLEKAGRPAEAWRNHRWDSFTLVTPNWFFQLPGAHYQGPNPDSYMPREEIVETFERYIAQNHLPVLFNTQVTSVTPLESGPGYSIRTNGRAYQARRVVIATGLFQKARVPSFAGAIPQWITQVESGDYRRPEGLPPGAVLVVGSAQSGCQIAEELHQAGRKVYLSTGTAGRFPRRYRGRDIVEWAYLSGFLSRTPDMLPSPRARFAGNPHVTGKGGGHDINLHQFYREGVVLLGHIRGAQDGSLIFAPDLHDNLARSDQFAAELIQRFDAYIAENGLVAPEEQIPILRDGYAAPENRSLDLREAGISTIVWACGHTFDFSLVQVPQPLFDEFGFPITQRGVTQAPGLYFLGMPWLYQQKSGLLVGVGEDARYLAEHILLQ